MKNSVLMQLNTLYLLAIVFIMLILSTTSYAEDRDYSYTALNKAFEAYMAPNHNEKRLYDLLYENNGYSTFLLSRCNNMGIMCKKDLTKAERFASNNTELQTILINKKHEGGLENIYLGLMALDKGGKQNEKKAYEYFMKDYHKVDDAMDLRYFMLGNLYLNGIGIEKDDNKAEILFNNAQKYTSGTYNLAYMYRKRLPANDFINMDSATSNKIAVELYEAAAIRGDRDAQAEVYEIYSEGLLGTSINKVKARQYLTYGVISPTQDMIDRWLSQGYALRDIGDLNEEYQENKQASMKLEQVMEACESLKRELVQSEEILDEEKDDIDYWADHVQSSTEYSRETAQLNYNINYQEYKDALYDYNRLIRDWNERCDKSEEDRRDPWFRE